MRILSTCPIEEHKARQAIARKLLDLGSGFNIAHGDGFENLLDLGINEDQFFKLSEGKNFLEDIYPNNQLKFAKHLNQPEKLQALMDLYASNLFS